MAIQTTMTPAQKEAQKKGVFSLLGVLAGIGILILGLTYAWEALTAEKNPYSMSI